MQHNRNQVWSESGCIHGIQEIENWAKTWQKSTKWPVRPAKTQISLGIRPVWSVSSLCALWVAKDPMIFHADSEEWSVWSAQADLSLRWAHRSFCWFCHAHAQLWLGFCTTFIFMPSATCHYLKGFKLNFWQSEYFKWNEYTIQVMFWLTVFDNPCLYLFIPTWRTGNGINSFLYQ